MMGCCVPYSLDSVRLPTLVVELYQPRSAQASYASLNHRSTSIFGMFSQRLPKRGNTQKDEEERSEMMIYRVRC